MPKDTNLHKAAYKGEFPSVEEALDQGEDVNLRGAAKCTALHRAVGGAHLGVVAKMFLSRGLNCFISEFASVEEALDQGEDVNLRGAAKRTALHRAVGGAHLDVVELLLERNADVDARDGSGRTPLHWAAVSGSVECGQLLVSKKADVNGQSNAGATSLHMSAEGGKVEFVQFLLDKECDRDIVDKGPDGGRTALDIAKEKGHKEVVALLRPESSGGCCVVM